MLGVFSYLVIMTSGLFWLSRVAATLTYVMKINFILQPINLTFEVILLFAWVVFIVCVVKRKLLGTLAYFVVYSLYFGTNIYDILNGNIKDVKTITLVCSIIGVAIPVFAVLDLVVTKDKKKIAKDKKSDWFYDGNQFDRQYDERADKNQYKF